MPLKLSRIPNYNQENTNTKQLIMDHCSKFWMHKKCTWLKSGGIDQRNWNFNKTIVLSAAQTENSF